MYKKLYLFILLFSILVSSAVTIQALDEEEFITDYLWKRFVSLKVPERPKIVLVLGGGGARGLAHIGVLKVLEEEKVPVDMVVGTSVGALIGALYCAGVPIDHIEKIGETVGWNQVTNVRESTIIKLLVSEKLMSTEKMEKYLNEKIGNKRFDELKTPFVCLATDLMTGEKIILREGEVALAARASSTIPGVFDPVEYRHRFLIDGGLFDNIPVDVAKLLGGDFIITSAVSADIAKNSVSNVFMILTQAIYIQGKHMDAERLKDSDVIIRPQVSEVTAVDLGKGRECIDAGISAARQTAAHIKRELIGKVSTDLLFGERE
ncbi:MAG: patatin-like phospholipase family protein [Endomicrobiales bacterium]|nr:patatin-like phospholipase family protein [Endomicrobiales bacterium]